MKRLYWRPKQVSHAGLLLVGMISVGGMIAVELFRIDTKQPGFDKKVQAAELARRCMDAIKDERINRGESIDSDLDPAHTGMIGKLMTPVTSVSGDLGAKQTAANPNFAAVVVEMLLQAGVRKGDVVAVGFTGSFPSLNICVIAALETLEAKGVMISSASASQFGANLPDLLWIDMERILHEKGLLTARSVACSLGGYEDVGLGLSAESRDLIMAGINRNQLRAIQPGSFTESIDVRMSIFREQAARQPIKAYINVGGGAVSVGRSIGKGTYQPGLNKKAPRAALKIDSVMTRFMKEGVPALHLVQIREIAEAYGLPSAPAQMPTVGEGKIYFQPEYNSWLALSLLVAIFLGLYAFVLSDVGLRILKGIARQRDSSLPHPAV
ncbi:poly-gamma-glutamate system protein [bacterium]|jgi:poly-gamma-glutamate system protein|nr:poly-gamma-glutamate system protein [bacterium]